MSDDILKEASRALEVANSRIRMRKLLDRYHLSLLPLPDLLAHAWLCGAVDVLMAQQEHLPAAEVLP